MPDSAATTSLSDQQMVRQALANPEDFALIIHRYEMRVRRYVNRLGQSGTAQDDVMQNIFIQVWVNLNGFDPSRPLAPWIWRIAYTQTMLYFRQSRPQRMELSGDDIDAFLAALATEGSPERALDQNNMRILLSGALNQLTERTRSVLVLRFLEDCAYLEIAEILHIPSGTVATLIHRGLRSLKSNLAQAGATSVSRWSLP